MLNVSPKRIFFGEKLVNEKDLVVMQGSQAEGDPGAEGEQAKRERKQKENEDEYTEEMLLLPPGILRGTLCHGVISREDRRGIRVARRSGSSRHIGIPSCAATRSPETPCLSPYMQVFPNSRCDVTTAIYLGIHTDAHPGT